MIPVRAEAVKNIKNAAAKINKVIETVIYYLLDSVGKQEYCCRR